MKNQAALELKIDGIKKQDDRIYLKLRIFNPNDTSILLPKDLTFFFDRSLHLLDESPGAAAVEVKQWIMFKVDIDTLMKYLEELAPKQTRQDDFDLTKFYRLTEDKEVEYTIKMRLSDLYGFRSNETSYSFKPNS